MQGYNNNPHKAECSSPEQPVSRRPRFKPTPVPRWSNESKIKEGMRRTTLCETRLADIEERLLTIFSTLNSLLVEMAEVKNKMNDLQEDVARTHESTRLLVDAIDTM